jgi:hypothetical protein
MITKICTTCNKEKTIDCFYTNKNNKTASQCKSCRTKKQIEYYKKYPWKRTFQDIKTRCTNTKYKQFKDYGGRGIKNKFKNSDEIKFLWLRDKAYLMKKPSIDRKDNDGNYELSNCRFIEMGINSNKNKIMTILQFSLNNNFIKEWPYASMAAKELNIDRRSIAHCAEGKYKTAGGFIWKYKINFT